ncbi:hypothetical protein AB0H03_16700 [Streptomyces sparsogenes]|uniref:hypothetical protein n=1 Tax=Streptomyces sparsogenes TaxID=67365 RepID=UPI0034032EF5
MTLTYNISWDSDPVADAIANSLLAMEVLDSFHSVFRPSVVDAVLACRYREIPEMLLGDRPPNPRLRMVRSGGPDYDVDLIPVADAVVSSTVQEIEDSTLRPWLTSALQQDCAGNDALVTLEQFSCWYGSAWLSSAKEFPLEGTLRVNGGPDVPVQLTAHEGDLWVAAPGAGYAGLSPVALEVMLEDERLVARIRAAWMPWARPGSNQHGRLLAASERLAEKGWQFSID